ncbi:MAG: hypothetical protein LQ337_003031 [Flavoplaca oasis]|nr:MAG: hypothetical protein LQ337_003031 [Flavoplaca oasis]
MSEPHIKQDPEQKKSSMAHHDKPKPHIRACESCRTRKIRCLPQDSSKDAKCQRCAKSGRDCIYSSPEKRKRRKRTDARVADLEHMVQMLAARLEHEQQTRLDQDKERDHQQPHQGPLTRDKSALQKASILSPPPSPSEYHQRASSVSQANRQPHFHSPIPNLARENSTRGIGHSMQTSQSPLPTMAALSPNLIIHEPLPSPLPQTCTPTVLNQQYTAWPSLHPSLDLEPHHHQQTSTAEDVYSPCPSHSSTISQSETCSSEISQSTILDIPAAENDMMYDFPATAGTDFNAMDAAISAQLNMPCQDQGIWWPQSNITGNDFPSDAAAAVDMGNWMHGEEVFSWQTMQWA